jgi:hypothetical protein
MSKHLTIRSNGRCGIPIVIIHRRRLAREMIDPLAPRHIGLTATRSQEIDKAERKRHRETALTI